MPRYTLTIGEQADLALHRLALELNQKEVDVLRNAINTYATLRRNSDDGYVWVKARNQKTGNLGIRRIALP